MARLNDGAINRIAEFVKSGTDRLEKPLHADTDPTWRKLRSVGTDLWLDTGDIAAAEAEWTAEMSALTTNNTLLNREVQKGIYDELIAETAAILPELDQQTRVREIGFVLNAWHGRRLVQRFDADVSVELHTDLAHDLDGIVETGLRFRDIDPERFIVKVPLTATGLLGARRLREHGVRINFTLEFSARQNAIVAMVTRANYCNVFLGRVSGYLIDNGLGDGVNAGERTTIASQRIVRELTGAQETPTRQIAASMRSADEVFSLAGLDVFTMPTAVAAAARGSGATVDDRVEVDYPVTIPYGADTDEARVEVLWEIDDTVLAFARSCDEDPPDSGEALALRARGMGVGDLFPELSESELRRIAADGKIPRHDRWRARVGEHRAAIDSLLNLAGLAAFADDQQNLDNRIAGLIG